VKQQEFTAAVCKALREELRACQIFETPDPLRLPPPNDLEAERVVLDAAMSGRASLGGLGVAADDFWNPLNAALAEIVLVAEERDAPRDLETVGRLLCRAHKLSPERVADSLSEIERTPARVWLDLYAQRLRILARRRRAIAIMQRIDATWRSGGDEDAVDVLELGELLRGAA
jgi:replicative DNA helicase